MAINKKYVKIGAAGLAVTALAIGLSVGLTQRSKSKAASTSSASAYDAGATAADFDRDSLKFCSPSSSAKSGKSGGGKSGAKAGKSGGYSYEYSSKGSRSRRRLAAPGTEDYAAAAGRRKLRDELARDLQSAKSGKGEGKSGKSGYDPVTSTDSSDLCIRPDAICSYSFTSGSSGKSGKSGGGKSGGGKSGAYSYSYSYSGKSGKSGAYSYSYSGKSGKSGGYPYDDYCPSVAPTVCDGCVCEDGGFYHIPLDDICVRSCDVTEACEGEDGPVTVPGYGTVRYCAPMDPVISPPFGGAAECCDALATDPGSCLSNSDDCGRQPDPPSPAPSPFPFIVPTPAPFIPTYFPTSNPTPCVCEAQPFYIIGGGCQQSCDATAICDSDTPEDFCDTRWDLPEDLPPVWARIAACCADNLALVDSFEACQAASSTCDYAVCEDPTWVFIPAVAGGPFCRYATPPPGGFATYDTLPECCEDNSLGDECGENTCGAEAVPPTPAPTMGSTPTVSTEATGPPTVASRGVV